MPLIRWTYERDVAKHGDKPFHVSDLTARWLLERRRVELVEPEALAELTKPELAEVAEQVGVKVPKRDAKGHFIKKITEAEGP
ncbi:MAG TPA: hypothetical protein VFV01_16865 [Spirillospora sp.]|nr:hypothetical protein [Spirillospora sp.]